MKDESTIETTTAASHPHNDLSNPAHGAPEVIGVNNGDSVGVVNGSGIDDGYGAERTIDEIEASKKGMFAYFMTKDFYIVLVLGYDPVPCATADATTNVHLLGLPAGRFSHYASRPPTPSVPCWSTREHPSRPFKPYLIMS